LELVHWADGFIFSAMKELLALFMLLPSLLFGYKGITQSSSSRFSIVISPAIFIPVTVAVQGGVQYNASRRIKILAEAAVPIFYPENTQYEKIDYLRTGLEIKYVLKSDSFFTKYVSLQNNYLFRELTDVDQAFYYTKTQTFSYTNAIIKSPVLSSAVKLGVELNAGKRFFVDAFIGAGVRFIFTEYQAKTVLLTSTEPPKQNLLKFDDAWKYNYTLIRLHATAGLRFGVRL
jgi:hypothetical protein